jgi:hypothetical protein
MLWGRVLALPANNRLGCEGLPGTLAYYENTSITDIKSFITLASVLHKTSQKNSFVSKVETSNFDRKKFFENPRVVNGGRNLVRLRFR